MSTLERLFHTVLFELLGASLVIIGLILFTNHQPEALSGTVIVLMTIAMIWNFVFNAVFDRFYPGKREQRSLKMRIYFVLVFEAGLLLLTIPVMAYILNVSLLEAFLLDIGVTIFLTLYAFVFNYCYDHIRAFIIKRREITISNNIETS
jgi:uncharacterized membrane protein